MAHETQTRGVRDYCYLRGKTFWYLYRYPADVGGERVERSLRTSDFKIAKLQAAMMALGHKRHAELLRVAAEMSRILERAKRFTPVLAEPNLGTHELPDGSKKIVTKAQIISVDSNGRFVKKDENEETDESLLHFVFESGDRERYKILVEKECAFYNMGYIDDLVLASTKNQKGDDPKLVTKDATDAAMLAHYFARKSTSPERRNTYEKVLEDFFRVTGKTIAGARYEDGEALANYYDRQKNKRRDVDGITPKPIASGTTQNKVGCLRSLWYECEAKFELKGPNPFQRCCQIRDDKERREPLTEDEVAHVEANLHRYRPHVVLAWKLLLHTGARPSEMIRLHTKSEFYENGLRCVHIVKPSRFAVPDTRRVRGKTKTSERRIPWPTEVIPFLPIKIEGPLFGDRDSDDLSNDLNDMLRELKIATRENGKVAYCLRHRAKDRLRATGVLGEYHDAILGHTKRTVADDYGKGFPMLWLHEWMQGIGLGQEVRPLTLPQGPPPRPLLSRDITKATIANDEGDNRPYAD